MAAHNHQLGGSGDETEEDGSTAVQNNLSGVTDLSTNVYRDTGTSANMAAAAIANQGGGGAHENRQPFVSLSYIIALQGTYPSRS